MALHQRKGEDEPSASSDCAAIFFTCVDDDNLQTQQNLHVISATGMAVQGETFSSFAREGSECQLTCTCLMDCIATSLSTHSNAVFPQIVSSGLFVSHYHGWHGRDWRVPPSSRSTPCNALPGCAAFFWPRFQVLKERGKPLPQESVLMVWNKGRMFSLVCAHRIHICKPY